MIIFNRLLEKDEKQELPGETDHPEKSNDFFFCFNIKYREKKVENSSTLRKRKSNRE